MTTTLWILTAIIILLMIGTGNRILDNLRLNDKQAVVILLGLLGTAILGIALARIFLKNARYRVARFSSELFAGVFGEKRVQQS